MTAQIVTLDDDLKLRLLDEDFNKMLQLLLIADNASYILFDETHQKRCRREILKRYKCSTSGTQTGKQKVFNQPELDCN